MADLDAELLALAGGDDSGEEESMPPSPAQRSSPSRRSPSSSGKESPEMARKGVAQTAKKARSRKTTRRNSYSDDGEESSPAPSESASMSQSGSDDGLDLDDDEDKPLYAYEKIYHDADEKRKIQRMGEIEREQLIASRTEEVDRHEQNRQLHRLVAARSREDKKREAKAAKRKAADAGLDENQRKSSRQRTKVGGESKNLIDKYKQQRAEKNLRDEKNRQNRSARTPSPGEMFSDDDADGEEDDYDDRRHPRKRTPSPAKDDPPVELSEVQHARIGRDNFAQVCQTPGFEDAVSGCFARVNLGPGRNPGVNEYRLCQIKGIEKGRIYAMTAANGQQFLTDKYITATHGKAQRPWTFLECSMSRFTEDEWRRYRLAMVNEDCKMPTRGQLNKKLEDLNKLINHKWQDAEITAKLAKQRELVATVTKAKEREEIQDQILEARRKRDYDLEADLEEKLQNIVPMKLAMGTSLVKKEAPRVNAEQERLAELNRKNNKLNSENIRKAQLAEMHARRVQKQQRTASPAPNKALDDLFGDGSDISRAGTPVNGSGTPARSGTPANGTPAAGTPRSSTPIQYKFVGKKKGIPSIRKNALDDEIIAGIDLGIEIEL